MSTVNAGWRGPNIVKEGLVLYLDAASGTSYSPYTSGVTWRDISGNGNNGTLTNGPTYSSANGGVISFDGVDDYISGPLSTISSWTMSLWYLSRNISSALVYYPFSCTTGGNGLGFGGTFNPSTQNKWYFFDGTNVFSNNNTTVIIDAWYNLVVTKVSTSYNLYTNGNLSMSGIGVDLSCTQYNLGRRGDTQFYVNGNIASAQIYNRVLTPTEVLQNFNAQKSRFNL
jgi:hypothetical protein